MQWMKITGKIIAWDDSAGLHNSEGMHDEE